jgi:hypothetical protein
MAKIRTDEQILEEYLPRLKAFMDERLTYENAERIYKYLRPFKYDLNGWAVENAIGKVERAEDLCTKALHNIIERMIEKQPYEIPVFWNRLSYFENIIEKGLPSRDSLNEKIIIEAKKVFDSATEDDLTSFYSEVEIKHKLRDALCDTSMTSEMIQALYIKDDVLDEAYLFYKEKGRDNQVYLAVWEYLEQAEKEYLTDRIYDRIKIEYDAYINEVKKMPPENIIDEAYKLTIFYEFLCAFEGEHRFNEVQLKALLSFDNPLLSLYHEWQRRDWTMQDDIKDVIKDTAHERTKENGDIETETEQDYADEDEQEL